MQQEVCQDFCTIHTMQFLKFKVWELTNSYLSTSSSLQPLCIHEEYIPKANSFSVGFTSGGIVKESSLVAFRIIFHVIIIWQQGLCLNLSAKLYLMSCNSHKRENQRSSQPVGISILLYQWFVFEKFSFWLHANDHILHLSKPLQTAMVVCFVFFLSESLEFGHCMLWRGMLQRSTKLLDNKASLNSAIWYVC